MGFLRVLTQGFGGLTRRLGAVAQGYGVVRVLTRGFGALARGFGALAPFARTLSVSLGVLGAL